MKPKSDEKYSAATMVVVSDSNLESCVRMDRTLNKMQPALAISPMCCPAEEYLLARFPVDSKKVKVSLSKLQRAASSCQICARILDTSRSVIISSRVDWEREQITPSKLMVVCNSCEKVMCWSKLMTEYMNDSLLDSSNTSEFSLSVEHFLKVNGHKLSEIAIFNAALSLSVSLKVSIEKLSLPTATHPSSLEDMLASLVSA